jgi:hypothetical protein
VSNLADGTFSLSPKLRSPRINRPIPSKADSGPFRERTMPISFTKLRFSWIALAAWVGASLVTGDASAACTSMPDAGGCRPVCCRKASKSATPIRVVVSATVGQHFPSDDGSVCPDAAGCHCCPPAPTAPEPKERRGRESRPDPGRNAEAGWLHIGGVFRPLIGPIPRTISQPRKFPLYLRNSRLLI